MQRKSTVFLSFCKARINGIDLYRRYRGSLHMRPRGPVGSWLTNDAVSKNSIVEKSL